MRSYCNYKVLSEQPASATEGLSRSECAWTIFDPPQIIRVRRKRFRTHYWAAYSQKLGRYVGLYREIGHDHWVWIEADPTISRFTERPAPIRVRSDSRDKSHRFDIVLERDGSIECRRLFDVDSLAQISASDRDGIEMEKKWCESFGYGFRLITNADLRPHRTLIENWKSMLPYIREPNGALERRVLGYVSAVGEITLGEIIHLLADIDLTLAKGVVFGLLHRGCLFAPDLVTSPVSSATIMRICHD